MARAISWDIFASSDGRRVDVARAAIHSLGFSPDRNVAPIHISRIGGLFRRYYPNTSVRPSLDILALIGEVHELPDGRWLVASCRAINCSKTYLLLAPHPTPELTRAVGSEIRRTAYARLCQVPPPAYFEQLALETWLALPGDLQQWINQELHTARSRFLETTETGRDLKVYRSWREAANLSDKFQLWASFPGREQIPDGVMLLREETPLGQRKYSLGEFIDGKLSRECDLVGDWVRFRFGFDALRDIHMPIRIERESQKRALTLRMALPRPETRLLLTLASSASLLERGLRLEIDDDLYPVAARMLHQLGLELEET